MVELRKRPARAEPAPPPPAKKKAGAKGSKTKGVKETVTEKVEAVKETVTGKKANGEKSDAAATPTGAPKVGESITLAGFGGEVETNDGKKVTLAQLVEESKGGVVLFTYPKASTPGCTKQACFFRDSYVPLTATGYSIYGLSTDSPKANTAFQTKQNLPYPLLCDPAATLIKAIGLAKTPKGTTRGVFVIDKAGKVLAAEPGGPEATVDVVRKLVGPSADIPSKEEVQDQDDADAAKTAGEVADTAEKLDGGKA